MPKKVLKKEKKNQILRAAAKRFAKHGVKKTTLDEIAADVLIGKATIYHYFPSKKNLYYDAVQWQVTLFIEDIKAIFNNEEIPIGGRLLEYFTYKESVAENYKLLYNLMLLLFNDEVLAEESRILKSLLTEEEDILKLILSSVYSSRIESMNTALPQFVVNISWGLVFGAKLGSISHPDRLQPMKELLFKSLENLLG